MPEQDDPKPSIWPSLAGFGVFSAVVLAIWVASFFFFPWLYGAPIDVGVAGDMFGGVTALFSGLAFAGLISTLLMQRQELELQRRELRQSREEFSRQRFENTFFGLVRILNEHVGAISSNNRSGRDALQVMASALPQSTETRNRSNPSRLSDYVVETVALSFAEISEKYVDLYDVQLESDLGPYFRILFNLFRHIEDSGFSDDDKLKYARIARAYLSSAEIKLLMFNCASPLGRDFKPWVEKYSLLKHIHPTDARDNPQVFGDYAPIAFKHRSFD